MKRLKKRLFVRLKTGTIVYITDIVQYDDALIGEIDDEGTLLVFHRWEVEEILNANS